MADGHRTIDAMRTTMPRESCLGIEEVVVFVNVKHVLLDNAVVIGIVLVVIAAGLETYVAVLHVGKDRPLLINVIGRL